MCKTCVNALSTLRTLVCKIRTDTMGVKMNRSIPHPRSRAPDGPPTGLHRGKGIHGLALTGHKIESEQAAT
jgi:hypothetical protein